MPEANQNIKKPNTAIIISAILFLVIGLSALGAAAWQVYDKREFAMRAVPVWGKVIGFETHESKDDDGGTTTMYNPVFEYVYGSNTYTYVSDLSSSEKSYEVGEPVEILVDSLNPVEVRINDFLHQWILAIIFGFTGIVFTTVGYVVIRLADR